MRHSDWTAERTAVEHVLGAPAEDGREDTSFILDDWRVLLDADAVPRGLSAAGVRARNRDLLAVADLANELLARWNRPLITRTTLSVGA